MALDVERDPTRGQLQHNVPNMTTTAESNGARLPPKYGPLQAAWHTIFAVPWWAVFIIGLLVFVFVSITRDETYNHIFEQLSEGIEVTLRVSIFAYTAAILLGAVLGIIRSAKPKPGYGLVGGILSLLHLLLYNVATIFVEVLRGLPILVVLLVGAFIITPEIRGFVNENIDEDFMIRGQSIETAIIALSLAYGAFLSEVFRAGIQSIDKGQIEAAKSLGMTNAQTMRKIVFPQAVRRMIPPLGNDFIAMIKDSSLVALLAVQDVTQLAKKISGSNFKVVETYLVVTFIYLSMTFLGSLLVRFIENQYKTGQGESLSSRFLGGLRIFLKARPTAKNTPTE